MSTPAGALAESAHPPLRVLVALGLVVACTLAFQVLLTRLLSAVVAYHFSFLAISLALVGTGSGALLIYVRPRWFDRAPLQTMLGAWSAVYGLLLVTVPFALVHLDYTEGDGVTLAFAATLAVACVLAALPSVAAGIVVALAIRGYTAAIGKVYAYDLVGAGLGALLVVPALWLTDPATLIVALGVLAGASAILFTGSGAVRAAAGVVTASGLAVLLFASVSDILFLDPHHPVEREAVAEYWTPLARVTAYDADSPGAFALILYDRIYAPVPYAAEGGPLPDWRAMSLGPQSIGYMLTLPDRTLVIGGGGGRDIYNALTSGVRRVDVIELNEGIRRAVDDDLGHTSGRAYSRAGVYTTIGDGRSVLAARRSVRYNVIHIGFTDTLSGNAAQGFALTENNLYTLEAFDLYLDRLAPGGILKVSRLRRLVGEEALRTTVLTLAALERRGIAEPERHVVVIRGHDIFNEEFGTVLARLEPFTDDELAHIAALADERGDGLMFAPDGPYYEEWGELAAAGSWQAFCRDYYLDVCPSTDDRPFFFNMRRLGDMRFRDEGFFYTTDPSTVLLLTLVILVVLSAVAFVLPLYLGRDHVRRPSAASLSFFGAIGVGFLVLEIALIQRFVLFLGFPTYALSVVLFALLVFTGIGSLLTGRFRDPRRGLVMALAAAVLLLAVSTAALQPLLAALIGLPFPLRVLASVALLAPFGLLLGMAMPIGLRRFEALFPTGVAYAWGVNGVASVLASVLGVTVALYYGIRAAMLVATGCYLFALLHALLGRWPEVTSAEMRTAPDPAATGPAPGTRAVASASGARG